MLKNTPVTQKLHYLKVFPATALNVDNTTWEGRRDTAVHIGTP